MHLPKNNILASSRNALKSSASLLTLAVGSVGWSELTGIHSANKIIGENKKAVKNAFIIGLISSP